MTRRRLFALASTAALLSTLLLTTVGVGVASAQTLDSPAHFTSTGANTLNWSGQGSMNGEVQSVQCSGDTPDPGDLLWIFTTDGYTLSGTPVLHVNNGTVVSTTAHGGSWHIATSGTSPDPAITDAYVDFTITGIGGGSMVLTISHGCPEHHAAIAEIATAVHLGTNHTTDIAGTSIPLGSTVHDSASLTSDPTPITIPDGSSVTFYFFEGTAPADEGACVAAPELADDSVTLPISGDTPASIDDALAQGPLAAGDYFYYAVFSSGDTDVITNAASECEPFTVNKGTPDVSSELHSGATDSGAPVVVAVGSHVALGSTLHDSASVTEDYPGFDPTGNVAFFFYMNGACTGDGTAAGTVALVDGVADPSTAFGPLAPGDYAFKAHYLGDANFNGAWGPCEDFTVDKGPTTTVTEVHDAAHTDITNGVVVVDSWIHDKAIVSGLVDGFTITGDVTFRFFMTGDCTGTYTTETVAIGADGTAESTAQQISAPGAYSYRAMYGGDANYAASGWGACEPFTVVPRAFGYTMGFWGNKNGQALLAANDAFGAGAVALGVSGGCYVLVDSASKSLQILPKTLNGHTLTGCALDSAINKSSYNVLLAQTLALSYNILYKEDYAGQTITNLGCTAVSPLTGASTVQQVRDYANWLIGNAKSGYGATVTQSQIGAMNTLLGCLNRES